MTDLQLIEYLIDTTERLLTIVREQNARLAELGASFAAEQISAIDRAYTETMYGEEVRE